MAPLQRSALFEALLQHDQDHPAIVHSLSGRSFTYGSLLQDVVGAKDRLLAQTSRDEQSIVGERVAFLIENSYDYVVTLLAILASNAIAVPLAPYFPASELRYIINHSDALALQYSSRYQSLASEVLKDGLEKTPVSAQVDKITQGSSSQDSIELVGGSYTAEGGMMLYTSGTTARPKGVLLHHMVLIAQARSLLQAWDYSKNDRLLHVLPLHHIHGTVNALLAPLLAGSTIEMMFPFTTDNVWSRFAEPFLPNGGTKPPVTFFTVVPTIWARLQQSFPALSPEMQTAAKEAIQRKHLRLNISGSAALPTPTKKAWTDLSNGNVLLERFGMTEVGMALSCGLHDSDRIDGAVGWPLPSVEARLVDSDTDEVIPPSAALEIDAAANGKPERSGEIQLRGPTIFKGYWRNAEATAKEFTSDNWFKTGDIAVRRHVPGAGQGASGDWAQGPAFFILGRKSADIIKTGGEKVSALEIERELLSLPEIAECAVVGLSSETWGQKVAAVVMLTAEGKKAGKGGKGWGAMDMRRALKGKLVAYKIPQDLVVVEEIPRNAMGKVNKKDLVGRVFGDGERIRRRSVLVSEERRREKGEVEKKQVNGVDGNGHAKKRVSELSSKHGYPGLRSPGSTATATASPPAFNPNSSVEPQKPEAGTMLLQFPASTTTTTTTTASARSSDPEPEVEVRPLAPDLGDCSQGSCQCAFFVEPLLEGEACGVCGRGRKRTRPLVAGAWGVPGGEGPGRGGSSTRNGNEGSPGNSHVAVPDYQTQLMQANDPQNQLVPELGNGAVFRSEAASGDLASREERFRKDYEMQLMLLEQQNKKQLLKQRAQAEKNEIAAGSPESGSSTARSDGASQALKECNERCRQLEEANKKKMKDRLSNPATHSAGAAAPSPNGHNSVHAHGTSQNKQPTTQEQFQRQKMLEWHEKQRSLIARQGRDGETSVPQPPKPTLAQGGNHALQDFQMQLMLLEQQNNKRLAMARAEEEKKKGATDAHSNDAAFAPKAPDGEPGVLDNFDFDSFLNGPDEQPPQTDQTQRIMREEQSEGRLESAGQEGDKEEVTITDYNDAFGPWTDDGTSGVPHNLDFEAFLHTPQAPFDYPTRLRLLEQYSQKRLEMMGENWDKKDSATAESHDAREPRKTPEADQDPLDKSDFQSFLNQLGNSKQDYQLQLRLLEQQNKKRLAMARQKWDKKESTVTPSHGTPDASQARLEEQEKEDTTVIPSHDVPLASWAGEPGLLDNFDFDSFLNSPNDVLPAPQDYQIQLMLLEQQNKKRLEKARQEQEHAVTATHTEMAGAEQPVSEKSTAPYNSSHPVQDHALQPMLLEQQNQRRLSMARQQQALPGANSGGVAPQQPSDVTCCGYHPGAPHHCHGIRTSARQDYEVQLMLLEQQNKARLLKARQVQDEMCKSPAATHSEGVGSQQPPFGNPGPLDSFDFDTSNGKPKGTTQYQLPNDVGGTAASQSDSNGNTALQDYQMGMHLLEQQDKKRLLLAEQEQDQMAKVAAATHACGIDAAEEAHNDPFMQQLNDVARRTKAMEQWINHQRESVRQRYYSSDPLAEGNWGPKGSSPPEAEMSARMDDLEACLDDINDRVAGIEEEGREVLDRLEALEERANDHQCASVEPADYQVMSDLGDRVEKLQHRMDHIHTITKMVEKPIPKLEQLSETKLRADVDQKVVGLEGRLLEKIDELEDRLEKLDPDRFTPASSAAGTESDNVGTHEQRGRPSTAPTSQAAEPVLELHSEGKQVQPQVPIPVPSQPWPLTYPYGAVSYTPYWNTAEVEMRSSIERLHQQNCFVSERNDRLDRENDRLFRLLSDLSRSVQPPQVQLQQLSDADSAKPRLPTAQGHYISPGGVDFRDREIARQDEQLKIAHESLKASEEAAAQTDAELAKLQETARSLRQGMMYRVETGVELREQLAKANKCIELYGQQASEQHVEIGHLEKSLRRLEKEYHAKERDLEYWYYVAENRADRDAEREAELTKVKEFCEQKDVVIQKQQQNIEWAGQLLVQRDRELEGLHLRVKRAEEDAAEARKGMRKKSALLRESENEVARLGFRGEGMGRAQQRYEEMQPSIGGSDMWLGRGSDRHVRMDDIVEVTEQTPPPPPRPRPSLPRRTSEADDEAREDRRRSPVWGEEGDYSQQRSNPSISAQASDAPNPTEKKRRSKTGGRHRRSSHRQYPELDKRSTSPYSTATTRGWDSEHRGDRQSYYTTPPMHAVQDLDDMSTCPPLPAPVTARRMASEADLRPRHGSRGTQKRNALSKHSSMMELPPPQQQHSLQAYVETEAESGGEEFGGV
ncbi:uncharacterized protein LTR77_003520 [Saxophila tyrrhenica]|uniref:Acetyl-CoA synthetase-like protein n=1 Tax=Saxophila tyrrhenica TaxID=1690608 RepID=A0AAV9PGD7_9PEZI|nr:hypothetical protein LTR77_003520 [Saxophila tyrrhenica]